MSILWWEKTIHDLPWPSMTFHDLPWPSMTFYHLLRPLKPSMIKCLLSRPGLIKGPLHSTPLQINSKSIPRLDPILIFFSNWKCILSRWLRGFWPGFLLVMRYGESRGSHEDISWQGWRTHRSETVQIATLSVKWHNWHILLMARSNVTPTPPTYSATASVVCILVTIVSWNVTWDHRQQ